MSLAAHGASARKLLHSEGGTEAICVLSLLFSARWQGRDVSASYCLQACGISAEEDLPGSSSRASLLSLASFPGSLSVALEGSLASNELSKLWMTACHTKQLLLPAPLRCWLPTPNSCGIPTRWCLHGGRARSAGARAQPCPALPLCHYGQWEGRLRVGCEREGFCHKIVCLITKGVIMLSFSVARYPFRMYIDNIFPPSHPQTGSVAYGGSSDKAFHAAGFVYPGFGSMYSQLYST